MRERKNVYSLPHGDNTLSWYAKAVLEMRTRPATDPTSWYFQAGMHGFERTNVFWENVTPLPPQRDIDEFWNQCQHGSWYFLSWHRMYLAYFEQIVAATVASLGGPADWALPFWDYSDSSNPNRLNIPPAFTTPSQPTNGLWIAGRSSHTLNPRDVTLGALQVKPFTGDGIVKPLGFGGPETGFSHQGRPHGHLEYKPHDLVHVEIGGAMGNPKSAALDPIFWLHHANIDRLWQVWINQGERFNPREANWLDRKFPFHNSAGQLEMMASHMVEDTTQVLHGYSYEGVPTAPPVTLAEPANVALRAPVSRPLEVIAAKNTRLDLRSEQEEITLELLAPTNRHVRLAKQNVAATIPPETYLHFENITGRGIPSVYDVYLIIPKSDSENYFVGSLPFFGIQSSSIPSLHHSGSGQHYAFDVSDVINQMRSSDNWEEKSLSIRLVPRRTLSKDASVNIGRVSLYHHE